MVSQIVFKILMLRTAARAVARTRGVRKASGASFPAETPLLRAVDYVLLPAMLLFAFKLYYVDDYLNVRRSLPWAAPGSEH